MPAKKRKRKRKIQPQLLQIYKWSLFPLTLLTVLLTLYYVRTNNDISGIILLKHISVVVAAVLAPYIYGRDIVNFIDIPITKLTKTDVIKLMIYSSLTVYVYLSPMILFIDVVRIYH